MPQCKRNNCKEEAQRYGKRLCPKHAAEAAARSAAYRALPRCSTCRRQHTRLIGPDGEPECKTCCNEREASELLNRSEARKFHALRECEIVEDLKEWLEDYILTITP